MGYANLTRILSRPGGLLERAEAALRETADDARNDAPTLLRLGDVQRSNGRLGDALECYRRVLALRSDDAKASWLVAILSGTALPAAPPRSGPVPFVRRTDFLSPRRGRELLALGRANRERFKPAVDGVVDRADPSRRMALVERTVTEREVRPWFEPRLRDAFSEALPRLRLHEPRPACEYWLELAMSAHLPGGFFAKHTDNDSGPGRTRRVNFAYYFHHQPRPFSGGDLLLHDAAGGTFTRIDPQHNSIVFFPASAVHQTTIVERAAGALGSAVRFAIQGWLGTNSSTGRPRRIAG